MATLTSPITPISGSESPSRTVLVYTSDGVTNGTILHRAELDELGVWLCDHDEYCAHFPYTGTAGEDAQIERERRNNGGYCNRCRDYAGKLLSVFSMVRRAGVAR